MISFLINMLREARRRKIEKVIRQKFTVGENVHFRQGIGLDIRMPKESCGSIGDGCLLACSLIFESDGGRIDIGDRTYIGGGTSLISRSGISIGSDVTIAWGVYVYDHDSHSLDWRDRTEDYKVSMDYINSGKAPSGIWAVKDWSTVATAPIKICDKAWIGFDSVILKGVTIGEGAVIGARSVVTRDVPAWTVAAGNPARVVKELPRPTE